MAAALVPAAATVASYVGGEWYARNKLLPLAEQRLAEALGSPVTLTVPDDRLLVHLGRRQLPWVQAVAVDVPVDRARAHLRQLQINLEGLALVGRREERRLTATGGSFRIHMVEEELMKLVKLPSNLVSFQIVPDGMRLKTAAGMRLDAAVALEGQRLRVTPDAGLVGRMLDVASMRRLLPEPSFRLTLPTWPYGARLQGMKPRRGWVEAWGIFDERKLDFPIKPKTT